MSHNPKTFHWSAHSYCKKMKQQSIIRSSFGLTESQDYDSFHFFENEIEQDFYAAPTPSEDIWKKFELIPTPPRSPRRDDEDDTDAMDMVDGIFSPKSTTERLQLVSEILDDPISQTVVTSDLFKCACSPNIKSKLIQDCMWSGPGGIDQDTDEKSEEKPVEKKPTVTHVISSNTDCVDPSSVFPYPINDTSKSVSKTTSQSLGVETPSESENDDEEEDDDYDDDEEIDVVTVDRTTKFCKRRQPSAQIVPNIKIKVKTLSVPPQSSVATPFLHNYSMKRKSLSLPASPQPSAKRLKRELSMQEFKQAVRKLQSHHGHTSDGRTSRSGSDSEDCEEKRAQHNVLERKRRNDLKFSFFSLRDQIPDLERQERAPKVLILRKAAEYIIRLRREHRKLEQLKQLEQNRKEQLQRKLALLRRTC